jgi:hypothetical protein
VVVLIAGDGMNGGHIDRTDRGDSCHWPRSSQNPERERILDALALLRWNARGTPGALPQAWVATGQSGMKKLDIADAQQDEGAASSTGTGTRTTSAGRDGE